jgi:hypothetical protein
MLLAPCEEAEVGEVQGPPDLSSKLIVTRLVNASQGPPVPLTLPGVRVWLSKILSVEMFSLPKNVSVNVTTESKQG